MFIKPPRIKFSRLPHVFLNDIMLNFVEKHTYLGVILNHFGDDSDDIKRQMRSLYSQANSLIRKFHGCSTDVKIKLFQTFCSAMYCSHLWSVFTKQCISDMRVAYNNSYRILMNIKHRI